MITGEETDRERTLRKTRDNQKEKRTEREGEQTYMDTKTLLFSKTLIRPSPKWPFYRPYQNPSNK